MFGFTISMNFQIFSSRDGYISDHVMGSLVMVVCLTFTFGITQNILMYYAVQGDNNGVRISCIVFLILAWIGFLVPTILHFEKIGNIFKSDSSRCAKFKAVSFFMMQKLIFLARVGIYLGYFPWLVLFNRDKVRFAQEFDDMKYQLIPSTDLALFVLCMLHTAMMYQSLDEYSCIFEMTKRPVN